MNKLEKWMLGVLGATFITGFGLSAYYEINELKETDITTEKMVIDIKNPPETADKPIYCLSSDFGDNVDIVCQEPGWPMSYLTKEY